MGSKGNWLRAIVVVLVCAGCTAWGTLNDAEYLFTQKRQDFSAIVALLREHREIKEVSRYFDLQRSLKFIPKYGEFTAVSKTIYADILEKVERLGLHSVRVERFSGLQGGPVEVVEFVVFIRGMAGSSELIVVSHFQGDEPIESFQSPDSVCRQIESPEWYVCHLK